MPDFRVDAFLEARECLRLVRGQKVEQPEFWANLLGAIANAAVANLPDSTYEGVMAELARQEHLVRLAQRRIREELQPDEDPPGYRDGVPKYYHDPDFLRGDPQQRK